MDPQPRSSAPQKNIHRLVKQLAIVAFFSFVSIVSLAYFGIQTIYTGHIVNMAEKEAILLSNIMVTQQRAMMLRDDLQGKPLLQIKNENMADFDQQIRHFLHPFNIVKIKIFSPAGNILFSTEAGLIGQSDPQNNNFIQALKGLSVSQLKNKESLRDLSDEEALDVDVVEIYTPILSAGQIVGVVELYVDVTKFSREVRKGSLHSVILLMASLLIICAAAFFTSRAGLRRASVAEEKLLQLALYDGLTGVLNRRELMSRAHEEISRYQRTISQQKPSALSLILLDLDHFKRVNDAYGHLAGDQVLRELPQRISQVLRNNDILGRFGGEEFMILLPASRLEASRLVAERIRRMVADQPFHFKDTQLPITCSMGVATFGPDCDLIKAINRADQALLKAKKEGRNKVVCDSESPESSR